jgi:uncharacterized membrane protein HdeD (DUF308 family)
VISGPDAGTRAYSVSEIFRSHWLLFVFVGGLLIAAGAAAMVAPALSSVVPNEVLGFILMLVGIVQIVQSGKMHREVLFAWHLALGIVAATGGFLVYLEPFPGIVTKTLVMAGVFALHGLTQIVFSVKVRYFTGWHWFMLSGCIALIVAGLMVLKLPYNHSFTPATVGGISLLFSGYAYLTVALAARRS